ncbi:nucleotidyltransferase family protein [Pseudolactococcus reticulitermitis]|uniref:Nucleotidyltransferase family protein n=1 Tax=Pseudolactococcus reticulitermitis TaxID=2025039 RepID=A0A224XBC4_9LACT|nr:nucleotidyltransferase family protein [Lactococcus reticulitermitis]GAX47444.1 hypothetical protein RsY01_1044 [Lactococcus reticulitermitis]
MNEEALKTLLSNTPEIVDILQIINQLNLPDTWLCAGIIRNFIWNYLSEQPLFDEKTDVDVVFFDPDISDEATQEIEKSLKLAHPTYAWEVKNQAHMHLHNPDTAPYLSARDAMARFPERCTAIGARLTPIGEIDLFLPYGLADITDFVVRPTPFFAENADKLAIYRDRQAKKNWQEKWPQLRIISAD